MYEKIICMKVANENNKILNDNGIRLKVIYDSSGKTNSTKSNTNRRYNSTLTPTHYITCCMSEKICKLKIKHHESLI